MVVVIAIRVGGTGCWPEHARLFAHFFDDLLEQLWEGLGFTGTQEGEGAVLHLGRPVGRLGVEGVEKVFLDPSRRRSGGQRVNVCSTTMRGVCVGVGERRGKLAVLLLVMAVGNQMQVQLGAQVHIHGGWCVACCSPWDLDLLVWF